MEGTGTDLGVIGLHDGAAVAGPIGLELEDHVLERQRIRIHLGVAPLQSYGQTSDYFSRITGYGVPPATHPRYVLQGSNSVNRPIAEEGDANEVLLRHGTEVARIGGILPVITHDPNVAIRNGIGKTHLDARRLGHELITRPLGIGLIKRSPSM